MTLSPLVVHYEVTIRPTGQLARFTFSLVDAINATKDVKTPLSVTTLSVPVNRLALR